MTIPSKKIASISLEFSLDDLDVVLAIAKRLTDQLDGRIGIEGAAAEEVHGKAMVFGVGVDGDMALHQRDKNGITSHMRLVSWENCNLGITGWMKACRFDDILEQFTEHDVAVEEEAIADILSVDEEMAPVEHYISYPHNHIGRHECAAPDA